MPKISTDEWLKELDSVIQESSQSRTIVEDRGFTIYDIMERTKRGRTPAKSIISDAIKTGKIKQIGFRPGIGGIKVFEVIK